MKKNIFISSLLLLPLCLFSASLVSVSPADAVQGQTLAVTITGANTHFNQASSTIYFSQGTSTIIYSGIITKINDTSLQANFTIPTNASIGNYDLTFNSSIDGNLTLLDGFLINLDPTIKLTSISPSSAVKGQTLTVTIEGVNTHLNQVNSTLSLTQASSSTTINSGTITKINNTTIQASFTIPANASLGNYNVNLNNSLDGSISLTNAFQVLTNISLVSVSPAVAVQGQTLAVTITGANTHFNQASSSISLSQGNSTIINSGTITISTNTSLQANFTIPANTPLGNYDLNLNNLLDGNIKLSNGFQVLSNKALVSVNPANAKIGDVLTVTITGANTHFNQFNQASSTIYFRQGSSTIIYSETITKINDTSLQANFTIPTNVPLGDYDLNVSNSLDGNLSLLNGFRIDLNTADISKKTNSSLNVFPNPFAETIHLYGIVSEGMVTISDLNGRKWITKEVFDNDVINVSSLSKGLYILKLITKEGITTQKITRE